MDCANGTGIERSGDAGDGVRPCVRGPAHARRSGLAAEPPGGSALQAERPRAKAAALRDLDDRAGRRGLRQVQSERAGIRGDDGLATRRSLPGAARHRAVHPRENPRRRRRARTGYAPARAAPRVLVRVRGRSDRRRVRDDQAFLVAQAVPAPGPAGILQVQAQLRAELEERVLHPALPMAQALAIRRPQDGNHRTVAACSLERPR